MWKQDAALVATCAPELSMPQQVAWCWYLSACNPGIEIMTMHVTCIARIGTQNEVQHSPMRCRAPGLDLLTVCMHNLSKPWYKRCVVQTCGSLRAGRKTAFCQKVEGFGATLQELVQFNTAEVCLMKNESPCCIYQSPSYHPPFSFRHWLCPRHWRIRPSHTPAACMIETSKQGIHICRHSETFMLAGKTWPGIRASAHCRPNGDGAKLE